MHVQADTIDRIAELVGKLFARRGIAMRVEPEDDLLAAGLSSLDLVNLMLAVEGEFDVMLPEEQMTPGNFRTIAAIKALLATLS